LHFFFPFQGFKKRFKIKKNGTQFRPNTKSLAWGIHHIFSTLEYKAGIPRSNAAAWPKDKQDWDKFFLS
jgi:hypothetical protein